MDRIQYGRESSEFDRSLSFFDAVYGFALTLLVVNLDVPPPDAWRSLQTLLAHGVGTQLLGFLISFVVIVAFWRSNQGLIARFGSLDGRTITLNIVLTGLIVFIPFTTQGISDPATDALALPTVLYALNIGVAIVVQIAIYQLALNRGLTPSDLHPKVRRAELVDALMSSAVFFCSIPVALAFGGTAGKMMWLSMVVIAPVTGRAVSRARQRAWQDGTEPAG